MLLLIDNYDSFTYNLVQDFGELGCRLVVKRNDEISLDEIAALAPNHISASRRDPARRAKRELARTSYCALERTFESLAFALDTNASPKHTEEKSCALPSLCMGSHR